MEDTTFLLIGEVCLYSYKLKTKIAQWMALTLFFIDVRCYQCRSGHFFFFSVLAFLNVTREVGKVERCYELLSWKIRYVSMVLQIRLIKRIRRISKNLDFNFITFQWCFMFVTFVFQFSVWIILNSTIIHKQWKTLLYKKNWSFG